MNIIRLILSGIGFLLSFLVFYVHAPSGNTALLMVAAISAIGQLNLFVNGLMMKIWRQAIGSDAVEDVVSGFGRGVCETQVSADT
jgi:hypothetical protein